VVEGDQTSERDADRIRAAGARALQINTGTGCHLDASMVGEALRRLAPQPRSLLFIENVGNLVCPALFDLGERARVLVASVTEGEDKPVKYPHMFRASDVVVLNKIDLLPHVSFDTAAFAEFARGVKPGLPIFELSATRGDGFDAWCGWLTERLAWIHSGATPC
jgi:hydrogenase nickel incorporation protein HypB